MVQDTAFPPLVDFYAMGVDPFGLPISYQNLSTRHNGKSNQCFIDGHVELFDPNLLLVDMVKEPNIRQSPPFHKYVLVLSDW